MLDQAKKEQIERLMAELDQVTTDLQVLRVKYAATWECKEKAWVEVARLTAEVERLEEETDLASRRRGGECCKCGRWVCPPLTCMACLADAPEELRAINAGLTVEVEQLRRERDMALIEAGRQWRPGEWHTDAEWIAIGRTAAGLGEHDGS